MLTRRAVIMRHADEWRNLRAWGRSLDNLKIEYLDRRTTKLGVCHPTEQRIKIYLNGTIAMALSTVVHEMAHAVEMQEDEMHGPRWARRMADAAAEIVGHPVVGECGQEWEVIDQAVEHAMRVWWKSIGGELVESAMRSR